MRLRLFASQAGWPSACSPPLLSSAQKFCRKLQGRWFKALLEGANK